MDVAGELRPASGFDLSGLLPRDALPPSTAAHRLARVVGFRAGSIPPSTDWMT